MSPQDEAALDGLSAHDPHKQAPLYSLYERSGQMGAGELEQVLQGRNAAVPVQSGAEQADSEAEEDGEGCVEGGVAGRAGEEPR